jgi:hypothetical protein
MTDERPPRSGSDLCVDLRLAAMLAAHEQRKWSVVREVIHVLERVGASAHDEPGAEPTDRRETR